MYVKPSANTPAAIRKAAYLRKQAEQNKAAHAAVVNSVKKG